jgi:hypothetical protein
MAVARHATFTNNNRHGVTYAYITLHHGRHTKIHYVTTNNMAAERHTTFTNTNILGVTASTYVTLQHGRHTKLHYVTANNMADA